MTDAEVSRRQRISEDIRAFLNTDGGKHLMQKLEDDANLMFRNAGKKTDPYEVVATMNRAEERLQVKDQLGRFMR